MAGCWKNPYLRCAQSPRVNVLPMYVFARRLSRVSPLDLFEQPALDFLAKLSVCRVVRRMRRSVI